MISTPVSKTVCAAFGTLCSMSARPKAFSNKVSPFSEAPTARLSAVPPQAVRPTGNLTMRPCLPAASASQLRQRTATAVSSSFTAETPTAHEDVASLSA